MQRREFIQSLLSASLAGFAPVNSLAVPSSEYAVKQEKELAESSRYAWRNWSGSQQCNPRKVVVPKTIAECQQLLRNDNSKIRMVGAGHSFSPLVNTDDLMLSIRHLQGLEEVDQSEMHAKVLAGTTLNKLGPELDTHGQALVNMPDIDQQTLAGAISTATHGTGRELHCLSHYVKELSLVTAQGELVSCSEMQNPDLFRAAQVGLGSMGLIVSMTLQNRRSFKLKRQSEWRTLENTLEDLPRLSRDNRNVEFYYLPFTGMTYIDTLNITEDEASDAVEIDGNDGLMSLKTARDYLADFPRIRELILKTYMRTLPDSSNIDHSYLIYASERNVRFNEMEYHLPIEAGPKALRDIVTLIEKEHAEVFFPIECRFIKADDCWLSPFYQRDTFSIAVHRYFEEDYQPLFRAIEPIFQKYGGRPHWGKLNTMDAKQFSEVYPKFQDFAEIRKEYDPEGRFLNTYLETLFT